MRVVRAAAGALFVLSVASSALPQQPAQTPAPAASAPPASAPPQPRTFTAPVGLLLNTVRADRVEDFEKAMAYLQAALASSTNERVRAQAAGWRIFRASEAPPGGAVLYVFLLDPAVAGAFDRRPRQHRIFRSDPPLPGALLERGDGLLHAGGAMDEGAAHPDQAGALGIGVGAALERQRAELGGGAVVRSRHRHPFRRTAPSAPVAQQRSKSSPSGGAR